MSREERASLGLTEPWMRFIGLAIWAFIGVPRIEGSLHAWLIPWALYGLAIVAGAARERLPEALNVALVALQTACVLCLPRLGLIGFEGLLLSVVVVQLPLVISMRASIVWAIAHLLGLVLAIFPYNAPVHVLEAVGAYTAFSTFALLLHWLRMQERRARLALAASNASLLSTRAMLVEGSRQAERLRISRELHDSLGHHLTALGLQLDLARRQVEGKAAVPVARAHEIAKESLSEVRKVVSEMQTDKGIDLVASLKALAAGLPSPRITIRAPDTLAIEDGETSHALFRCVQEAITNAVKHAAAQNVWVDLEASPSRVRISIRDDGRGVREVSKGRGLEGMSARVAQLRGSVQLESAPGRGFAVSLQVPLEPERS